MAGPGGVLGGQFTALRLEEREDRLHVVLDRPEVRNAIDATMVEELHTVCGHLERHPKVLILSGTEVDGKGVFASGADIAQLRERRRDDALAGINSRIFDRIHRLPMPVIAALGGYALGGGAELAYAADFRIATPLLKLGQPETGLGIIAAAGGLWRLKELVGEPVALDILLAGRILDAQEALALHLVTELHEPARLVTAAHALADRIGAQDPLAVRISKRVFAAPPAAHPHIDELAQAVLFESRAKFDRMQAFLDRRETTRTRQDRTPQGRPPAEPAAGADMTTEHSSTAGSTPSAGLRSASTTPAAVPTAVGVLGGGRMGAGIAHAFLLAGSRVTVVERDGVAADAAQERIERDLLKSLERGAADGTLDEWSENLTLSLHHEDFADAQLVVEAVPEAWELKVQALREVERNVPETAWLATNTSSLSVDGLAAHLARPERFCGLHFFNPVPASALVEVVVSKHTGEELKELAVQWVKGLGKTPVVVNDAPGFASSRLGVAIALEAIRMVEEGVASPEDIDNAMVLGYRFPVGPLALTDIVGLDVRLGIAEHLASTLGPRFEPPQLMRDMVARGELGRKTGRGFFGYDG